MTQIDKYAIRGGDTITYAPGALIPPALGDLTAEVEYATSEGVHVISPGGSLRYTIPWRRVTGHAPAARNRDGASS